jgi:hypothetical protein
MDDRLSDRITYGTVDRDYEERLRTIDPEDDGPIWMLNLMKYRDVAVYPDGRESNISGAEADALYAPFKIFTELGAELVLYAPVEAKLLGDDIEWDAVAIVAYPSRAAFIAMQDRPDYLDRHIHKEAGMEQTLVIGCVPMPMPATIPAFERASFDDAPHPPTPEDPPVLVMHLVQLADGKASIKEFDAYSSQAAKIGFAQGARVDAWLNVEGTAVGDGRRWDQARFNAFPSMAAFMAVVTHPDRQSIHKEHREVAMSDTYTLVLRPMIDRLAGSVDQGWS